MTFIVYGIPAPQGSKRHVGHGVMIESSAKVKPWREAVYYAAICPSRPIVIRGAVRVSITFTLPRPKTLTKGRVYPETRPDLDKLVRSTFDALTRAGVYEDDNRVVELSCAKVYVGGFKALDRPGAVIQVEAMPR